MLQGISHSTNGRLRACLQAEVMEALTRQLAGRGYGGLYPPPLLEASAFNVKKIEIGNVVSPFKTVLAAVPAPPTAVPIVSFRLYDSYTDASQDAVRKASCPISSGEGGKRVNWANSSLLMYMTTAFCFADVTRLPKHAVMNHVTQPASVYKRWRETLVH
jgi:hypothetical protein